VDCSYPLFVNVPPQRTEREISKLALISFFLSPPPPSLSRLLFLVADFSSFLAVSPSLTIGDAPYATETLGMTTILAQMLRPHPPRFVEFPKQDPSAVRFLFPFETFIFLQTQSAGTFS